MALYGASGGRFSCHRWTSVKMRFISVVSACMVFTIVRASGESNAQNNNGHPSNSHPSNGQSNNVSRATNGSAPGHPRHHAYLHSIFNKYGNEGLMTFEGFEHLLENLGIGNLHIDDHGIKDHFSQSGFKDLHPDHNHTGFGTVNDTLDDDQGVGDDDHLHGHQHNDDDDDDHYHPSADRHLDDDDDLDDDHNHHSEDRKKGHDDDDVDLDDDHNHHNNKETHKEHDNDDHKDEFDSKTSSVPSGVVHGAVKPRHPDDAHSNGAGNHDDHDHHHGNDDDKQNHRAKRFAEVDDEKENKKCMTASEILSEYQIRYEKGITEQDFLQLCPAIVFQIDEHTCTDAELCSQLHGEESVECEKYRNHDDAHSNHIHKEKAAGNQGFSLEFWKIPGKVWGYALLSVTIISLVGLASVAVIPLMRKVFYSALIQFLVALAVGSLTGDALLHLLPHALLGSQGAEHSHDDVSGDSHHTSVFMGMVALSGMYLFFIMERVMVLLTDWRTKRRKRMSFRKKVQNLQKASGAPPELAVKYENIGSKLSSYDKDYDDILMISMGSTTPDTTRDSDDLNVSKDASEAALLVKHPNHHNHDNHHHHEKDQPHKGHGHSHDIDEATSVAAIAWMVIMGDGLHNFSDGLAIGASFANSLTGGLSTSVAVFCHELPHELGDFAVLLRAGMSVKQALTYNIVSSVLCFLGMFIGIVLGNISSASLWIFTFTAGTFIYISLVDMMPELTEQQRDSPTSKCCTLLLQCVGISTGVAVMLVIALFEHKIKINLGDNGS